MNEARHCTPKKRADGRELVCCADECDALLDPHTLEEYVAAYEHWRRHSWLGGCSHGD